MGLALVSPLPNVRRAGGVLLGYQMESLLGTRFFLPPNLRRLQPQPSEVRFAGSVSTALALVLWQEPLWVDILFELSQEGFPSRSSVLKWVPLGSQGQAANPATKGAFFGGHR